MHSAIPDLGDCLIARVSSAIAFSVLIISSLFLRFSRSVRRWPDVAFFRHSKKQSHASMKRRQMMSLCFLSTGPMVFHSFCSSVMASAVFFQSVLSFRASARAHRGQSCAQDWMCAYPAPVGNNRLCGKEVIAGLTETGKRALFTFFEAKPSFFHSSCAARISLVACSQDE